MPIKARMAWLAKCVRSLCLVAAESRKSRDPRGYPSKDAVGGSGYDRGQAVGHRLPCSSAGFITGHKTTSAKIRLPINGATSGVRVSVGSG